MTKTTTRNPHLDNTRFILVILVVFGHLISPMRQDSEIIYWINNLLASFRMPALILLTGFFAKKFYKEGYVLKITKRLFVPYLVFQLIGTTLFRDGHFSSINWFEPLMGLWFLLSLYQWNLLLFLFHRLKYPIIVSIIVGIGIGCIHQAGTYFSVSRTFVFFPFFLIGFYAEKAHFEWFRNKVAKVVSLVGIGVSILILSQFTLLEARNMLLGRYSYLDMGLTTMEGIFIRFTFYVLMLLGIITILSWVPKQFTFYTKLGQKTAYIYLLHLFILKYVRVFEWLEDLHLLKAALYFLLAFILSLLLSSKLIIFIMKPVVEGTIVDFIQTQFDKAKAMWLRRRIFVTQSKSVS
ncbi:fucose 4-O-acetylase-like acetyltransferase [Salirhabdus euzebyi]|uniref:Fucose 4-O-acetylase-like acetyltransferase n=1 Tax=Salirhabdus euzebyi TaxID=394506 RepID=A0A841QAM0_9BACI|nr:acyltransferase family protein [Salirhabdus euzebyi]MBB6455333.1 fucose 4-O-acetylase-like acetyltransferase [Salirhabdus euzebyi]